MFDLIPEEIAARILTGDTDLRQDLLAIPYASYLGWKIKFENDDWKNPVEFTKGNKTVTADYTYYSTGLVRWKVVENGQLRKCYFLLKEALYEE